MAEATVKLHLTSIFKIIGVTNRQEALVKAPNKNNVKPPTVRSLTDLQILNAFANTACVFGGEDWSTRILEFGHEVDRLSREENYEPND
jgi:trans-2-enoyl-CoA reductase